MSTRSLFTKSKVKKVSGKGYHTSNPKNRESILAKGLVPSVGESYSCQYDDDMHKLEPAIFVVLEGKKYYSCWDDDVWEIDLDKLTNHTFYRDFYVSRAAVTNLTIPPDCLKLVYEGTGCDAEAEEVPFWVEQDEEVNC
jgi:hypothetical protein